jgi:hypothetical protein
MKYTAKFKGLQNEDVHVYMHNIVFEISVSLFEHFIYNTVHV